jgi:hypothetical protein
MRISYSFRILNIISMNRTYYSHPGKELKYHLENVRDIGLRVFSEKGPLNFSLPSRDLELSLSYILYYHDIGKSTDYFQEYLQCQAVRNTKKSMN